MQKVNYCTIICLILLANFGHSQLKVGENPDQIDNASIVELESTSKALILSRVSNNQMLNISPLRGAMVYNTETACIHYFDGIQWNNLCDATSSVSFTKTEMVLLP